MTDLPKIWVLSDLHQEYAALQWAPSEVPEHDIVVLAGDIHSSPEKSVEYAAAHFEADVVLVCGNHEFYGHGIPEALERGRLAASRTRNVRFLEDNQTVLQGIRFIGSTLWTDFDLFGEENRRRSMAHSRHGMKDFDQILAEEPHLSMMAPRFTPNHARQRHLRSRSFIGEALSRPFEGPSVVVTHHAPARGSIAPVYEENAVTPSFGSDLSALIRRYEPAMWIHGHTHTGFDYEEGRTRIICNPRGYEKERPDFDPAYVVRADGANLDARSLIPR